jgi:proliferating cell nuclear antigen
MSIDDENSNELQICVENIDKRSFTKYRLKLLDIDVETITIPEVETEILVTIPSVDLQRITRDISNLSETVMITAKDETLEFACEGDFANQQTCLGSAEHGLTFKSNGPKKTIEASYNVKYINMFCKASSVSPIMEIHLKDKYPLIMRFPISLGVIQFVLAPKMEEE